MKLIGNEKDSYKRSNKATKLRIGQMEEVKQQRSVGEQGSRVEIGRRRRNGQRSWGGAFWPAHLYQASEGGAGLRVCLERETPEQPVVVDWDRTWNGGSSVAECGKAR